MLSFKIIIPTFKRSDNQIFFNSIDPEFAKENVALVIQEQEKDLYEKYECEKIVLPEELNNAGLANTRQWIVDSLPYDSVIIADDDITIKERYFVDGKPKFKKLETADDWDRFKNQAIHHLSEVAHIGLSFSGNAARNPNENWDTNSRYMTIFGFNLERVRGKINFNFIEEKPIWTVSEDLACNMQLLSQGLENRILYTFITDPKSWWAEGGCSAYRTLERNNESNRKLHDLFPEFSKLVEKEEGKIDLHVQWKKLFKSSQGKKPSVLF